MKVNGYFGSVVIGVALITACSAANPAPKSTSPIPTLGPAVAANPTATQPKGGPITEATATDAKSFHLYMTTDITSRDYQFRVYASGLWQRDPRTNLPIPYMAESWSLSEDGRTYTFKLRKDMKWSDGVAITADDFIWTFDQAKKPENKYPYVSILNDIQSYTAADPYTIVATLKDSACTGILIVGQITPLPKHIWQNLPWADPEKNPEILKPSVVSGPWMLSEWKRDEYALFVPNDTYFGGAPKVDSYVVRIVPQSSIQFQMLKAGEIDFAPVSAADYTEAKRAENLVLYQYDPAQPIWYFLGFNFKRPVIQDVELRHALSQAMPRQAIADKIFSGLAKPMLTTYAPPSWAYNPNVPTYEYNIERAREVLDRAGYVVDSDGKRRDKSNNIILLKMYFRSGDKQREQIALVAQEEFRKLGVAVEVTGMESQALFDFLQKKPNEWDIWVGLTRDASDPHFGYQTWSESTIPDINTGSYINKSVEALYAQGNKPPCTTEARKAVYQQIQQVISTDSPYIFLVYTTGYAFANKRLVVNQPGVLGINYRTGDWYIKN